MNHTGSSVKSLADTILLRLFEEEFINDKTIAELRAWAEDLSRAKQFLCSESLFTVVNDHLGQPVPPAPVRVLAEKVVHPMVDCTGMPITIR